MQNNWTLSLQMQGQNEKSPSPPALYAGGEGRGEEVSNILF